MDLIPAAILMALVVMVIVIPSAGLWAVGGDALSRFIRTASARQAVNFALATVLVAMVVLIWI